MADNYLERQQQDYEACKQAKALAARKAWQKRLKAYKEGLSAHKGNKEQK